MQNLINLFIGLLYSNKIENFWDLDLIKRSKNENEFFSFIHSMFMSAICLKENMNLDFYKELIQNYKSELIIFYSLNSDSKYELRYLQFFSSDCYIQDYENENKYLLLFQYLNLELKLDIEDKEKYSRYEVNQLITYYENEYCS